MKTALLYLFTFFAFTCQAQELTIPVKVLSNVKAGPERYIGTDAFGWKYTTLNNEFRKSKDGIMLQYKAVALGTLHSADIYNPLQIVLFYKKFNTVVLLDNQLNETARINFTDQPRTDNPQPILAEAAGLASQNRLWLYDMATQQIGLYSPAQKTFKTLTPPFNESLKYFQSDYNYFYWIDSRNDCYAVNLFGKVNYLGTVPEFEQLQIIPGGERILFKKGNAVYLYNMAEEKVMQVETVEKSFKSFHYAAQILSIFTNNEIIQYKITLPE
ncbi:hypothetical protein [Flavobacterium sp. MK4S-17]|uniref:hypothetical protein n=1 Tax=Flavobacterium sp. MK4S-17 TaxID=2543737 RepID=UPI00135A5839|nr:hypothetical protein [Flavobacterium sp. MK4S-17]